jgi:hypothetical protein
VGLATADGESPGIIPADTIAQPVGKRAIDKANDAVRHLPKREQIIKVGQAGESTKIIPKKVPTMLPPATADVLPGDHRYAYQLEKNDHVLNLGDPTPEFGRWFRILENPEQAVVDGHVVNVKLQVLTETGYRATMDLQGNAAVKIIRDKENPYG